MLQSRPILRRVSSFLLFSASIIWWLPRVVQSEEENYTFSVIENVAVSCDFNNDVCPFQFNRICQDDSIITQCSGGDCYDCDFRCHSFHYNCTACIQHGCIWCPGDGFCSSAPLEPPFWDRVEGFFRYRISSSCPTIENWKDTCDAVHRDNVFSDPLYDAMKWAYELINVEPVWRQNITGKGVRVRINDIGVDNDHPDFSSKFDVAASCEQYQPRDMDEDFHGTAVAAIVAANANQHCSVGVAPDASISSCAHEMEAHSPLNLAATLDFKQDQMDISVNAWGMLTCFRTQPRPRRHTRQLVRRLQDEDNCIFARDHPLSPCEYCSFDSTSSTDQVGQLCQSAIVNYCALNFQMDAAACSEYLDLFTSCRYNALTEEQEASLANAVKNGRSGKGIIFVFAAGNSYSIGGDANFDGWSSTRYTISVGGVGKDGKHASYSTPGSALVVAGPGGDRGNLRNNIVASPGGGCRDATVGTSFACPFVAGVVALMLETNPDLGWRDVQGILALTSNQTDPDDIAWSTNAAGYHHSYKYGFGLVDAERAVKAASTWENFSPEERVLVESGDINVTIMDDPSAVAFSTIHIAEDAASNMEVESVVVSLDLLHDSRGDIEVVLTSPSGTQSILSPGSRRENTQLDNDERWELMTVRNWGETAVGNWNLTFLDKRPGFLSNCVDLPFEYVWENMNEDALDGAVTNCITLELASVCAGGRPLYSFVLQLETNGITADRACCICGGGRAPFSVSVLRSWQLALYGHQIQKGRPSLRPSSMPSQLPSSKLISSVPASGMSNSTVLATENPPSAEPPETSASIPLTSEANNAGKKFWTLLVAALASTVFYY